MLESIVDKQFFARSRIHSSTNWFVESSQQTPRLRCTRTCALTQPEFVVRYRYGEESLLTPEFV